MDSLNYEIPVIEIKDIRYNTVAILSNRVPCMYNPYDIVLDINRNECDVLSFSISAKNEKTKFLYNENIIKFNGENYIIKNFGLDDETKTVYKVRAEHESTILKDKQCGKIEVIAGTVEELINIALKDTGWVFGGTDISFEDKRHLFSEFESSFANLSSIAEVYNAILKFETKVVANQEIKSVSLYSKTVDIGRYARKGRDLKSVNFEYDTTNMVTRLTVFGGMNKATDQPFNMMEAHPQKLSYVEDYSFFTLQGLTLEEIKSNPRFCKEHTMNVSELSSSKMVYDYALNEIKQLSIPKCEANVSVLDLTMKADTPWEKPQLNETIHVFDEDINLELEATIVGISKNYSNPLETTISISNVIEKNSALKDLISSGKVVDKIIGSDGKIWGTYIANATIGSAQIGAAVIDTFHLKDGIIDSVHIKNASIDTAHIKKAAITEALIADASIGNQHVNNLSADKINAGKIDTAKVQIVGTDNVIEIIDGQILVNDTKDLLNPKNRVIVGKYRKNDEEIKYGILIRGEDGQTVMWDENGATNAGITDGAIDNNKVSVDANIDGSKLNIQTVIHSINNDTGAEKLNGLNIEIDGKSLSVKLTEINDLTDKLSTNISNNTAAIEQNAKEIALKVSQQDYIKDKHDITSSIGSVNNNLDVIRSSANMLSATKTFGQGKWDNIEYGEMREGYCVAKVRGMGSKAPSTLMSKQHTMFAKDEIFTLSVFARSKVEGLKLGISIDEKTPYHEPKVVNTEWNQYIWTFKGGDHIGFIIDQSRIDFDRIGTSIMPRFTFQSENATDTNFIEIYKPMVNPGLEAKEWTYSFNDLNKTISDSIDMLDSIVMDSVFSKLEKYEIRREIDIIKAEKIQIEIQANQRPEFNTLKQDYLNSYNALIEYISPYLVATIFNSDSNIDGIMFKNKFMDYYNSKVAIITEINKVLKEKVMQAEVEHKISDKDIKQSLMYELELMSLLSSLSVDKKITIKEKTTIQNIMNTINNEKAKITERAIKYSVSVLNHENAYIKLNEYLSKTIFNDLNTDTVIKEEFMNYFKEYLSAKKTVLESIFELTYKNLQVALTEETRYKEAQSNIIHESFGKISSQIQVLKDQISLKVEQSDIDKTIITTEIGGSNLIKGSKNFVMLNPTSNINTSKNLIFITNNLEWSSYVNLNESIPRLTEFLASKDRNYSFGINIKTSKLTSNAKLKFYVTGANVNDIVCEGETAIPYTNGDVKRIGLKIKFPKEITIIPKNVFVKMYGINDMGLEIAYSNPKLENGDKFTGWDYAPEDVDDAINNVVITTEESIKTAKAEIKVTTDTISNGVKANESYTKTVEDSLNKTKETVNVISEKTAQLEIDRDSIRGEVNGVKQESTETKKKLTDIEGGIGTENYILNAGEFTNKDNYIGNTTLNENYLQSIGEIKNTTKINLNSNQFYTYSVTVLPIRSLNPINFLKYDVYKVSDNTLVSNSLAIDTFEAITLSCNENTKTRIAIKIKTKANIDGLYYLNVKTQDMASYKLYNLQFEDGSLMSSFRLNSKERDTKIITITDTKVTDMKSVIDQRMDSISSKVTSNETTLTEVNGKITNHESRIKEAEQKITPESIISTVKSGNGKIFRVRYVRATCAGQKLPVEDRKLNVFTEIQAFDGNSVNVALNKTVTSNKSVKPVELAKLVDGNLRDFINITTTTNNEEVWMQVDLGKIYEDIEYIKVFHKNGDYRGDCEYYGTKVEVSDDGTTFLKLYDSNLVGTYKESEKGHTVKVNETYDGMAKQTEIKQLDDKISHKVSTADFSTLVEQNPSSVVTAFNSSNPDVKNGLEQGYFDIYRGKFRIFNQNGQLIFSVGQDGYCETWGLNVIGPNNPIAFKGWGDKGVEIRTSDPEKKCYIDFSHDDAMDYKFRIISNPWSGVLSMVGGLEIIPNYAVGNEARFELRSIVGGVCYIDFSHDDTMDYNTRIISYKGDPRLHIQGGLIVENGTKSAVQKTEHYGDRLMYAVEACENFYEDTMTCRLQNGKTTVTMSPIFLECVNTVDYDYLLHFDELDECEGIFAPIDFRTPNTFVVKEKRGGVSNARFKVRISARRKGYETKRLEQVKNTTNPENIPGYQAKVNTAKANYSTFKEEKK